MITVEIPSSSGRKCPQCGRENEAATGFFCDEGPREGDLSICIECEHLMIFRKDLSQRELTEEEKEEVSRYPWVAKAKAALRMSKELREKMRKEKEKKEKKENKERINKDEGTKAKSVLH